MKRKMLLLCLSMVSILLLLTGCTGNKDATVTFVEGLERLGQITVITREEGSGTRGVFVENTNLANVDSANSNADNIRSDAQVAMNAESVIEYVRADENAIGYISLGAWTENLQGIKVIAVNGIIPDSTTVKDNSYPLIRNFNIAYSGKMTDLQKDFLRYILSAGQDLIGQNYTNVKNPTTFLSDRSDGSIRINGSTSVAPLMQELAEEYQSEYNSGAEIEVQISDSTSGLTATMQGTSDFGMASRELKDYEKELLSYETIAKDAIAIVVNENNPTDSLSIDQLTQIFDGTDQNWKDINQ